MQLPLDKEHEVKNSSENTECKASHQMASLSQSNLPTKTETINQLSSSASLLQLNKHNMHKSSTIATRVSEGMAAQNPVQIGTRGTVGSLIMQEIKYFSQLELSCQETSQKPQRHITAAASTGNESKTTLGSSANWDFRIQL
ncbi:unnamed protein product [Dovyalis caffra]|uniref:Uncharacterized protein n=1 Tax=Dovyalis caffra TaxID=77055 RepID=A0AAV1RSL0_9ROSI|nr:unnamed protein product [Dovyalis caffra]